MKTLRLRVQEAARKTGVGQIAVERDYAQGYVLLGIAGRPELRESLVFKGGTALRKIHLPGYRFSEDLDFSAVDAPEGEALGRAVRRAGDAFEPALLDEVRATWERTPGPFVPDLPEVETVLAETRERLEAMLGP